MEALSKVQKQELYEWRSSPEGKEQTKKDKASASSVSESEISALVEKRVAARLKKIEDKKTKDEQAKEELKATLILCLSEMSGEEVITLRKPKRRLSRFLKLMWQRQQSLGLLFRTSLDGLWLNRSGVLSTSSCLFKLMINLFIILSE